MQITQIATNFLDENCWVVRNAKNEITVIDPGSNTAEILEKIDNTKVEWILLTHSHSDHLGALAEIWKKVGGKIAVHSFEAEIVKNGELNPPDFSRKFKPVIIARKLEDKDLLKFNDEKIEVIYAPGHTQGSCCFRIGNHLFSGDTLFRENVGRTDLPGGDTETLRGSLQKLLRLPKNTIVHPGHGEDWTIGEARNFFRVK